MPLEPAAAGGGEPGVCGGPRAVRGGGGGYRGPKLDPLARGAQRQGVRWRAGSAGGVSGRRRVERVGPALSRDSARRRRGSRRRAGAMATTRWGSGPRSACREAAAKPRSGCGRGRIEHPAETVMFADAAFLQGSGTKAKLIEYSFAEPPRFAERRHAVAVHPFPPPGPGQRGVVRRPCFVRNAGADGWPVGGPCPGLVRTGRQRPVRPVLKGARRGSILGVDGEGAVGVVFPALIQLWLFCESGFFPLFCVSGVVWCCAFPPYGEEV